MHGRCPWIYMHIYDRIPKQCGAIDLERMKEETMLPQHATWIIKEATRYSVKGHRNPQHATGDQFLWVSPKSYGYT